MLCKYCGSTITEGNKFCPSCGKNVGEDISNNNVLSSQGNETRTWLICLIISAVLVIILGIFTINIFGKKTDFDEVVFPAILSFVTVILSGYVYTSTKNIPEEVSKHTFSLILLILGALMAFEFCAAMLFS